MTNTAQHALSLVDHFQRLADSEPTKFRDHGGIHKGWTRTAKAEAYLKLAHRADRLYSRVVGLAPDIGPCGKLPA